MKRFFCTVCNKVKRVRRYPASVENHTSPDVAMRRGECARHALPQTNYSRLNRKVASR